MVTRTVVIENGVETELKDWDAFCRWRKQVIRYFEEVKEYAGYPSLPDFWMEGLEIFRRASNREKEMIANMSMGLFMECLQKWRSDMDTLYDPKKRKEFEEKYAFLEQHGKKYSPNFNVG